VSESTKEILDQFGTFRLESRGLVEMKVQASIGEKPRIKIYGRKTWRLMHCMSSRAKKVCGRVGLASYALRERTHMAEMALESQFSHESAFLLAGQGKTADLLAFRRGLGVSRGVRRSGGGPSAAQGRSVRAPNHHDRGR